LELERFQEAAMTLTAMTFKVIQSHWYWCQLNQIEKSIHFS